MSNPADDPGVESAEGPVDAVGLAVFQKDRGVPREEVRFGVILNGGVSLAVWMGGAVLELDRLTKASEPSMDDPSGSVYAHLLSLAGCTARADVISGTSAGGINGAALALCQVNRSAELRILRDVWVEQGRIESLLRQPFKGSPTSLLRGDEFFLPQLNDALSRLAVPSDTRPADEAPIYLSITTTVLRGNQTVTVDSMGQRLPQAVHAGRFHWSRPPVPPHGQAGTDGYDPFDRAEIARTAHRLALAARCTASFPVAFEPVFVPVRPAGESGRADEPAELAQLTDEQRLRPDMAGFVESWGDEHPRRDRSRFVVDGGVLANTPTRAALEGVEAMAASGPVRRVMLLVYPHATAPGPDPADLAAEAPTVAGAITGLLGALTAQGSRTFVDELEQHNLRAAGRRGTRSDILGGLPDGGLEALAQPIFEQYRRLREWRVARDFARWATDVAAQADPQATGASDGWNYERVRRAAEAAQANWRKGTDHGPRVPREPREPGVPYVPDALPTGTGPDPGPRWGWGVSGALGVAEAASDLLRRIIWVLPCDPPGDDPTGDDSEYGKVERARRTISETTNLLRARRSLTDEPWEENPVLRGLQPNQTYWELRLASYDRLMVGSVSDTELVRLIDKVATTEGARLTASHTSARVDQVRDELSKVLLTGKDVLPAGSVGEIVRADVDSVIDVVLDVLPLLRALTVLPILGSLVGLEKWRTVLLGDAGSVPSRDLLLTRLLQLEVAGTALGDEVTTGATLPLEVVQLSAQTQNAFTTFTRSGDDKLGGMSVNRFGGFLKRSWRVNDWTWGRLDAATVLCRTVLQPARVRRTGVLSGYLVDGQAPGVPAAATVDEVMAQFGALAETDARLAELREAPAKELAAVFDLSKAEGDLPASMPALAHLFAWALHLQIVAEEMPALAASIRADRVEGANARSNGEILLQEKAGLLTDLEKAQRAGTPPSLTDRAAALAAFDQAGVGREPLSQEASSDLTIRTATTAAAVGATVVDSNRSGLKAAKPVTRALRGAMLLPYWVVTALTSRTTLARGLALLGLAVGASLLALALLDALPSGLAGPAAMVGASAVLAAFAYGALRTGTMLHGLLLLTPIVPLVAYAVNEAQQQNGEQSAEQGVSILLVIVVLAIALMLLGSLPATTGSVWAALDRLADRQGVRPLPPRSEATETESTGLRGKILRSLRRLLRRVRRWATVTNRRAKGVGLWVVRDLRGPLLSVAAALALVWVSLEYWDRVDDFLRDHALWIGLGALAALAVFGWVSARLGREFQVLREDRSGDESVWSYETLTHPAGAAAGWSVLYGTGYLLLAGFLVWDPFGWNDSAASQALLITAAFLFVVVVLVVPLYLPLRARREAEAHEVARARKVPAYTLSSEPPSDQTLATAWQRRSLAVDLANRGVSYRWFVSDKSKAGGQPPFLTTRGESLEERIRNARSTDSSPGSG